MALAVSILLLVAFFLGPFGWGGLILWILIPIVAVLIFIRSLFFGVYVSDAAVRIVSWFWTYKIDRGDIRGIRLRNYDEWMLASSDNLDVFSANVVMVEFQLESGQERSFRSTSMGHANAKRAVEELRSLLGIEHVPGPRRRRRREAAEAAGPAD